jgi:hypothetical protein
MSARKAGSDPMVESALRRVRARQGPGPCSVCSDHRYVQDGPDGPLCYACRQARRGRSTREADHLAGRATWGSLTVDLLDNDHRSVSELRAILGFDVLPAAADDPLLLLAHLLAGIATLFALLVEYLVDWAGELAARHGPGYAAGLRSPVV